LLNNEYLNLNNNKNYSKKKTIIKLLTFN